MTKTDHKQPKTDNDLDVRFQWHEGLDPDHIFTEELAMIKELRGRVPQLEKESDKFVACFLFSRRHNLEDTYELFQKFYKVKDRYANYFAGNHQPSYKYTNGLAESVRVGAASMIHPRGCRDKKGRMLRYFFMGLDTPSARSLEYTYVNFFWQTYYIVGTEPLNAWRNGMAIVVDLKHAGLKNLDFSSAGREIHSAMQGTFPFRVRSMLVINGGIIINALLKGAKLALPKKLYDRIKVLQEEQLKEHVPLEHLFPQYGGTAPQFTWEDFYEQIIRNEEQMFSKGIWKSPDGASPASL